MRFPKTILVCGQPCKLIIKPEHDGGSFSCDKMEIVIGTRNPDVVAENFVHEVSEAILAIRDYRYVTEKMQLDSGDYRFFMDHKEFQLFIRDLALALRGITFGGKKKIK